jgi:hypothetical protein
MATISPLFVADADSLRASLRLTALNSAGTDAAVMVDDAIREVRTGFLRRLGVARVGVLVAIDYDPTAGAPANEDEILREVANLTEILWVRKLLLTRLPTTFRDASGQARLDWNADALTRETAESDRQAELERLTATIEDNLELLAGDSTLTNESSWKATTFGPTDPPRPEDTAYNPPGHVLGPYDW